MNQKSKLTIAIIFFGVFTFFGVFGYIKYLKPLKEKARYTEDGKKIKHTLKKGYKTKINPDFIDSVTRSKRNREEQK